MAIPSTSGKWLTLDDKNPQNYWPDVLEENIESYPGTFRFGSFT